LKNHSLPERRSARGGKYFSGLLKAESDARISLTETAARQIAAQMKVDPAFAVAASNKHAMKIVRKQLNANKVVEQAVEALRLNPPISNEPVTDISEDWLNVFDDESSNMSSEQMQRLFGRILASEIRKPSSYSIKTVKLMAQLDNSAAEAFKRLCSMCISIHHGGVVIDARVPSLDGDASDNSLAPYGLSFHQLNVLQEYGLIISVYNSQMDYGISIVRDNHVKHAFFYLKKACYFLLNNSQIENQKFPIKGVALSQAGRELFQIVDMELNEEYDIALRDFFDRQGKLIQFPRST